MPKIFPAKYFSYTVCCVQTYVIIITILCTLCINIFLPEVPALGVEPVVALIIVVVISCDVDVIEVAIISIVVIDVVVAITAVVVVVVVVVVVITAVVTINRSIKGLVVI